MKKVRAIDTMSVTKLYELGYISRTFFFEQLLGCGQQTLAAEGETRFCFFNRIITENITK